MVTTTAIRLFLMILASISPLQHASAGLLPDICASTSSASGASLTLATAGVQSSFTITARDDSGIPVTFVAGATFIMRLGDQFARTIVQHTTGTAMYVVNYDATVSGMDRLSLMLAKCK
jgi:hypothetical protein